MALALWNLKVCLLTRARSSSLPSSRVQLPTHTSRAHRAVFSSEHKTSADSECTMWSQQFLDPMGSSSRPQLPTCVSSLLLMVFRLSDFDKSEKDQTQPRTCLSLQFALVEMLNFLTCMELK